MHKTALLFVGLFCALIGFGVSAGWLIRLIMEGIGK